MRFGPRKITISLPAVDSAGDFNLTHTNTWHWITVLLIRLKKEFYPDQESYQKTEQHRFELLISHWDVMVEAVPLH